MDELARLISTADEPTVNEARSVDNVDYDERQHLVYRRGRAVSDETVQARMRAFARHVPQRRPLSVLDLGSGTGRYTPALAEAFGGPVYGVEPSAKMRQDAEQFSAHTAETGRKR